jgi:uncharacterized protein (DUF2249 family)
MTRDETTHSDRSQGEHSGGGEELGRDGGDSGDQPLLVDVRGLEPPLPMLRILELLDRLSVGQRLVVTHERRPIFLYPQLDGRGFTHQTEQIGPGEFRITIWRKEG